MHLKRLEIFGFKSFADKLEIVFPQGITGVVGPNGSGKSNISDALRWVLGEQSVRTLRGLRTEDVIFAGSEDRKPLGMAEVTLVLDNTDATLPLDFTEVSVTRRVYRSGESDFLINKAPVRLREIQDLFMDTGLGREAYSVIGQGKIDSILSAHSEERRAVFEEAAGIMRYKNKKALAVRKLEETEANLLRVNDIITELQDQLGPIGVQAAIAQQYLDLVGQLRRLEINCLGQEISRLKAEEERLSNELEQMNLALAQTAGSESLEEAALEEARLRLAQAGDEVESFQARMAELTAGIEKSFGAEHLLQERKNHMQAERQRLEKSVAELQSRVVALESELAKERETLRQVVERRTGLEGRHSSAEQALNDQNLALAGIMSGIETTKQEIVRNINDLAKAKHNANNIEVEREFLNRKEVEDQQRLVGVQDELARVDHRLARNDESHKRNGADSEAVSSEISRAREQLAENERAIAAHTASRDTLLQKTHKAESRLAALSEMQQSYQGYFQGVRSVLTEPSPDGFRKAIRGTVADVIRVQKGYETAMEVALGSSLQSVVVDTERHAREAIEWLRNNSRGRATFLPLDMIEDHDRRVDGYEDALKQFAAVPAVSVMKFDAEYRSVIHFLLGHTAVAPDMERAVGLSRRLHKAVRVVTPSGDIVNAGGSMTGGSSERKGYGLLERKQEIETLEADLKELGKSLAEAGRLIDDALKTREKTQAALQESLARRQTLDLERVGLEKEREAIASERGRVDREIELIRAGADQREQQRSALEEGSTELSATIARLEADGQALESRLRSLEAEAGQLRDSKEDDYRVLADIQASLAGVKQEELNGLKTCDSLNRMIGENAERIEAARAEIERLRVDETAADEQIAAERKSRESLEGDRAQGEERIRVLRGDRIAMTETLRQQEDGLRERRKRVSDIEHRAHRVEMRLNNVRNESGNMLGHLVEDYGPEWAGEVEGQWQGTLAENRAVIEGLKGEIRSLGPVNVGAIEENTRVRERHGFLLTQFDDLVQAKQSLLNVIEEIEHTTTRRFLDTFSQIREAFISVFNLLFEGGKADLYLVDPEKPLESGIEIEAQPPGKRLQSLTLLSGGERALTAIALLFAILRVKPTPFCILDEIDATLDEANVHRFADLLSNFSRDTQFIVVTHRRGTMELADALYGVTMEEMGVSKLISLQLKKQRAS